MSRTLVVYYSRTGTTRRAATEIARALGADVEEIIDRTERRGWVGYLRSTIQGTFRRLTPIRAPVHELAHYDLVVLGSPIWNASLSSPVRTFIREHHDELKAVGFFCTGHGNGGERIWEEMARESGRDPAAVLFLRDTDVSSGLIAPAVRRFVSHARPREAPPTGTSGEQARAPAA